jgi:hypothetical protein
LFSFSHNITLFLTNIHPNKGKKWTLEQRQRASIKHKGKKTKSVVQIDKNTNEIIKIWDSIRNAAVFLTGKISGGCDISRVCKKSMHGGKIQKTALGYKWEYLEEYNKKSPPTKMDGDNANIN